MLTGARGPYPPGLSIQIVLIIDPKLIEPLHNPNICVGRDKAILWLAERWSGFDAGIELIVVKLPEAKKGFVVFAKMLGC